MARDKALDFVKGATVLAMAVHHSINYFPAPYLSTKYVHFVSGAFPFLAGFMVSYILARRGQVEARNLPFGLRLVFRGARLLLLCGVLNLLLALFLGHSSKFGRLTRSGYLEYLSTLYWSGNYKQVSFSLLIPISYVLIALGILQIFRMRTFVTLSLATFSLFGYCAVQQYLYNAGPYYVSYFSIGMLGASIGCIPRDRLEWLRRKRALVIISYLVTLFAIAVFGQPLPLLALSVTATLLLFYMIGRIVQPDAIYISPILKLGQYSLLMYIVQIVILFALRVLLFYFAPEVSNALVGFLLVCALQLGVCVGMNRLRAFSPFLDRVYVAVLA
jgi:hypothetical protein